MWYVFYSGSKKKTEGLSCERVVETDVNMKPFVLFVTGSDTLTWLSYITLNSAGSPQPRHNPELPVL